MSHHLGRYRPTWLRWQSPLDISRIPGEFRRMFGPPFHYRDRQPRHGHARRDRANPYRYDDCECDCVQDCICGCKPSDRQRTPTPTGRPRLPEDKSSDPDRDPPRCERGANDEPDASDTSSVNLKWLLNQQTGGAARLGVVGYLPGAGLSGFRRGCLRALP